MPKYCDAQYEGRSIPEIFALQNTHESKYYYSKVYNLLFINVLKKI